jgi:hypothetical protein
VQGVVRTFQCERNGVKMDREIALYKSLPGFRDPVHRKAMLELFTSGEVYASLAGRFE